jgi:hypothetical protein
VQHLLDKTADFNLCAVPEAGYSDTAILTSDSRDWFGINGGYGITFRSILRRLDSYVQISTGDGGIRTSQTVGESLGTFRCCLLFCPEDFKWTIGTNPPPIMFDPRRPQRFTMIENEFIFDRGDSFSGYGIGRTSPVNVKGRPVTLLSGVGNVMKGTGRFSGLSGTFIFTGSLTRDLGLLGNIVCRLVDPDASLRTEREIEALSAIRCSDSPATCFVMRGLKKDRSVKTTYGPPPGPDLVSLITPSQMRAVQYSCSTAQGRVQTSMSVGPMVATMEADVQFNLLAPPGTSESPVPFTTHELYTFVDSKGTPVGTLKAGVTDGISFDLKFPGAPGQPGVRFSGFGPITGGTGPFAGVSGTLMVNSLIGISPHALSLIHALYVIDPESRFRA